jgi:hypothetical protein
MWKGQFDKFLSLLPKLQMKTSFPWTNLIETLIASNNGNIHDKANNVW